MDNVQMVLVSNLFDPVHEPVVAMFLPHFRDVYVTERVRQRCTCAWIHYIVLAHQREPSMETLTLQTQGRTCTTCMTC